MCAAGQVPEHSFIIYKKAHIVHTQTTTQVTASEESRLDSKN
jgi:hypothetical protein